MSQQLSKDGLTAFFDECRTEAVQAVYSHWANFHEPIGIERAAQLAIDRIGKKSRWTKDEHGRPVPPTWHWRQIPKLLTMRRRIEEGAEKERYAPDNPPIRCIGMRVYQGQRESQYAPWDAEITA